jgi:hypothetical protein
VLRLPHGEVYPVASHALYARRDWERFSFVHATDLHVTRRAEAYRAKLRAAGHKDGTRLMVNPNDSLRALIRWANALHDRGDLDFILATGDLVDYVFEKGDRRVDFNNFAFLHRLLLGRAAPGDPDGVPAEELRVPIYTVLGNHDYVMNAAPLFFEVDIPLQNDKEFHRWHGYNLTRAETLTLQDGHFPTISIDASFELLKSSEDALPYRARAG